MKLTGFERICIAIPTINERKNLEILLPELRSIFADALILIIDDGSTDGTDVYIHELQRIDSKIQAIFRSERLGIGSAHIMAMEIALSQNFELLITMDGDLTHSPIDAHKLLDAMGEHDLVIGSRYSDAGKIKDWSLHRVILTRGSHFVTKLFFNSKLDMSSGLRALRVRQIPIDRLRRNGKENYEFFFISTLVFLKSGLNVGQIGVTLSGRGSGKSKMNLKLMLNGIGTLFKYGLRIRRIQL